MVAGGAPTVQVLLDNGAGTFPYDITQYLRRGEALTTVRGRQDEQSEVEPGSLGAVFKNNDGRFTPGSTLIATPSPVVTDQRIRVKLTANGVTRDRCTGYLAADTVMWPGGKSLSLVLLAAFDAQARAQRQTLRSLVEEEIMRSAPPAYYTLGEPAGATSAADSSGNQAPALTITGSGAAMTFGADIGAGTDGLTAAHFAGGQYLTAQFSSAPSPLGLVLIRTGAPAAAECVFFGFACELVIETSGKLSAYRAGALVAQTTGSICDGLVHAVGLFGYLAAGQLTVDDATVGTWAPLGGALTFPQRFSVGGGGITATTSLTGTIAHVAVGAVPTYASVTTGFAGESGTARLTRLAGYGNLPIGTLDTSLTTVPFTDLTGKSVWDAIQQVADAEFGLVFFDGSGNLTFHNRNRAIAKLTPDVTITAAALDEGTSFVTDMQGVLNYYEVTAVATGVTQLVRNTVSEKGDGTATHPGHGRYPGSAEYLVQTDQEALDRGNWVVATHAEPQPRVGTLNIDLFTQTAAVQDALLNAEPNTWIRVTGLPAQTPGGTTADFIVEGFSDSLTKDAWSITLNVASKAVAAPTPWILDSSTWSVLDSTTRLYV